MPPSILLPTQFSCAFGGWTGVIPSGPFGSSTCTHYNIDYKLESESMIAPQVHYDSSGLTILKKGSGKGGGLEPTSFVLSAEDASYSATGNEGIVKPSLGDGAVLPEPPPGCQNGILSRPPSHLSRNMETSQALYPPRWHPTRNPPVKAQRPTAADPEDFTRRGPLHVIFTSSVYG